MMLWWILMMEALTALHDRLKLRVHALCTPQPMRCRNTISHEKCVWKKTSIW